MSSADRGNASGAPALDAVAMFPLPGMVLFPSALLPLHIFEPRYREMTRAVLAGDRHLVLANRTEDELGGGARPAVEAIAGLGEILVSEPLPDGRYNLVVRGVARVRIDREIPTDGPYRVVACTMVPDTPIVDPRELGEAEAALRALVEGLADRLPEGGQLIRHVAAAQGGPTPLVDVLASALIVDPAERQSLLETRDLVVRLARVSSAVVEATRRLGVPRASN